MAGDPVKLNHFTVKMRGSDASTSWMALDVERHEIGWRHGSIRTGYRPVRCTCP
jgi:hypothetical protein